MEKPYIEKIKYLLKVKNLTYKDLSKAISKSPATLLNIMNGRSKLDVDTLLEISEVLETSPCLLIDRSIPTDKLVLVAKHVTNNAPVGINSKQEIVGNVVNLAQFDNNSEQLKKEVQHQRQLLELLKNENELLRTIIKMLDPNAKLPDPVKLE